MFHYDISKIQYVLYYNVSYLKIAAVTLFAVIIYGLLANDTVYSAVFGRDERAVRFKSGSNRMLLVFWLFLIFGYTLTARKAGASAVINPVPFLRLFVHRGGDTFALTMRDYLLNTAIFVPVGMFFPFARWFAYAKHPGMFTKAGRYIKNHPVLSAVEFSLFVSLTIEIIQLFARCGIAETDDIIFNTIGGFIGTFSYRIANINKNLWSENK